MSLHVAQSTSKCLGSRSSLQNLFPYFSQIHLLHTETAQKTIYKIQGRCIVGSMSANQLKGETRGLATAVIKLRIEERNVR